MEIGVKVIAENTHERTVCHAITCYFTMVAMDEQGKPTPVPKLDLKTDDQKHRYMAASMRRELRRDFDKKMLSIKESKLESQVQ